MKFDNEVSRRKEERYDRTGNSAGKRNGGRDNSVFSSFPAFEYFLLGLFSFLFGSLIALLLKFC